MTCNDEPVNNDKRKLWHQEDQSHEGDKPDEDRSETALRTPIQGIQIKNETMRGRHLEDQETSEEPVNHEKEQPSTSLWPLQEYNRRNSGITRNDFPILIIPVKLNLYESKAKHY